MIRNKIKSLLINLFNDNKEKSIFNGNDNIKSLIKKMEYQLGESNKENRRLKKIINDINPNLLKVK